MSDQQQNTEITQKKILLREQYLSVRKALNYGKRLAKDQTILERLQGLNELNSARHVFTYISCGFEPGTHTLIDWLRQHDIEVSVPKIIKDKGMIAIKFPGWDKLQSGPLGIPQPDGDEEISGIPDICITPGVSFNDNGGRLGYGGGHYDRWLDLHRPAHKIGLAYEESIAHELPLENHDVMMDIIATEKRLIRIG